MGMRCHSCKSAISLNALPGKCCIIEKVKGICLQGNDVNTGEEYVLPGMEIILSYVYDMEDNTWYFAVDGKSFKIYYRSDVMNK
jgi:hypothetical protein